MDIDYELDLRSAFGPVRDQGARPTCLAFTLSDLHAAARGSTDQLSVEHLFYHASKRMAAPSSQGVSIDAAREALVHDGQSLESGWPYEAVVQQVLAAPPITAVPVFRHASSEPVTSFDAVASSLRASRPLGLVLLLGSNFFAPIAGVVDVSSAEADVALHGLVAVALGRA